MIGSFLSGLLITATASPCTAPFMGTAIGYAFSRSILETLLVFSSLGLGMAFSLNLLLCFFPKLLKYFPHPGSWNRILKHAMSIPMLAASVWLLSILYHRIELHLVISLRNSPDTVSLGFMVKKKSIYKKMGIYWTCLRSPPCSFCVSTLHSIWKILNRHHSNQERLSPLKNSIKSERRTLYFFILQPPGAFLVK